MKKEREKLNIQKDTICSVENNSTQEIEGGGSDYQ